MLSFTDFLRPPDGWITEQAVLATYSADLVVVVTSLLALGGAVLDQKRTGNRVELVKSVEALRGRVRVMAQAGRITVPNAPRSILKLLDRFVRVVDADESVRSWHPKVTIIRCHQVDDVENRMWRLWLGSRNLTRAFNWETGLVLTSRSDSRGQRISNLNDLILGLIKRANLPALNPTIVKKELAEITWECPPATQIQSIKLLDSNSRNELPQLTNNLERLFLVSPFLDDKVVRLASKWGNENTRRTLVSTTMELQRLYHEDGTVFNGFQNVLMQPLPDLPAEDPQLVGDADESEPTESEEISPTGLHAKLILAASRSHGRLWMGSPNATMRGWGGRNFETVAELSIGKDIVEAIEDFVGCSQSFIPTSGTVEVDQDTEALEEARKLLSAHWRLRQRFEGDLLHIVAERSPPLDNTTLQLEIAVLGGTWTVWPIGQTELVLVGIPLWQRTEFIQVRLIRGEKMAAWIQIAPCDPPPDETRDRALVSEYLDPRTFLTWLRSLLTDDAVSSGGGDWDAEDNQSSMQSDGQQTLDLGLLPTVEEILRAWARDVQTFVSADKKVVSYLTEIRQRARERNDLDGLQLLELFEQTWSTLSSELR